MALSFCSEMIAASVQNELAQTLLTAYLAEIEKASKVLPQTGKPWQGVKIAGAQVLNETQKTRESVLILKRPIAAKRMKIADAAGGSFLIQTV